MHVAKTSQETLLSESSKAVLGLIMPKIRSKAAALSERYWIGILR